MKNTWDHNLKIYVLNGILYSIMLNLYSPFVVKFLERLGGTEFHISMFNALPGLVAVFTTLPGTILVTRSSHKKSMTSILFLASRLFLLLLACVPLVPPEYMPVVFVLLFSLRNFPESVSQTAFQSFSGDLFTPEERSTAITLRSRFSIPATLLITLIAGQLLTKLASNEEQIVHVYQAFFIVAAVVGLIETAVFMMFKEDKPASVRKVSVKAALSAVFKDRRFMGFVKTTLPFYFAWQMGWPLFNIYHVITMGAAEGWLSAITIVNSIGMFVGYNYWNKLIKTKGNRYVIGVATLSMAVNPLIMILSPNLYFVTLLNLMIGFCTAGTLTVMLNYLLEVTPDENRVVYVGVYNTLVNISLAVSPFAGHAVLSVSNIFVALTVVVCLRFLGSMIIYAGNRRTINPDGKSMSA